MVSISSQHQAILEAVEAGVEYELWLGPARGVLDETTIVDGWLPTTGAGWVDKSSSVSGEDDLSVSHDGRGYVIEFTIVEESRLVWLDDLAVAVVARIWDGSTWTGRGLVGWAYLDGSGSQSLNSDGDQIGSRKATYTGYWERIPVEAHKLGKTNLAATASTAGSTPPLASVFAEAGLEYISQDDNDPDKAIDLKTDTVYIGDIIADPVIPTIGEDATVRILRAYAGRTVRSIGSGNEPVWIELSYVQRTMHWGNMTNPGAVPNLFEQGSNVRNDGAVTSSFQNSGTYGQYYQIRAKTGQNSPTVRNGVQWNVGLGKPDHPIRMIFEYKATSTESIGRKILVTFNADGVPAPGQTLSLAQGWQRHEFNLDSLGDRGGIVLRVQNQAGEVAFQDLYWGFRFTVYIGYSDLHSGGEKLHLSYDNGAGFTDTRRIGWDLTGGVEDWVIPPLGTVILADDAELFKAKFDPGERQVFQLRNTDPEFFFGPGIGKIALRRGNGFNFHLYSPPGYTLIDEVNFTTNGLVWQPYQGVSRQSPIHNGAMAIEDFPHVGLFPGDYGGGFIWLDLGAYKPTVMTLPMNSSQTNLNVEDANAMAPGMVVHIGLEQMYLQSRSDNTYTVTRSVNGTSPAAHAEGDFVTPRIDSAIQTGPRWESVTWRRKPGRPSLLSGVVITRNFPSPGDPSVGGARWERHPDWQLLTRFANYSGAELMTFRPPEWVRQARHICIGDVLMHRYGGIAQRWKMNEISVVEYMPGSSSAAEYVGHGSTNMSTVAAHILTQHLRVPASKIYYETDSLPFEDLTIAESSGVQILDNIEADADLEVWTDPYNYVHISPNPYNPLYDAREPYMRLDEDVLIEGMGIDWGIRSPVAQVRLTGKEVVSNRVYSIRYPDVKSTLGEIHEIKDAIIRSWADGRAKATNKLRALNARRKPRSVVIGPAPWVRPNMRVVYNGGAVDPGGQVTGVNCVILSFSHRFSIDENGGGQWLCELELAEFSP